MKEAGTIKFRDVTGSNEALALVHHHKKSVGLGIPRKSDGDAEVVMGKAVAGSLLEALRKAIA